MASAARVSACCGSPPSRTAAKARETLALMVGYAGLSGRDAAPLAIVVRSTPSVLSRKSTNSLAASPWADEAPTDQVHEPWPVLVPGPRGGFQRLLELGHGPAPVELSRVIDAGGVEQGGVAEQAETGVERPHPDEFSPDGRLGE